MEGEGGTGDCEGQVKRYRALQRCACLLPWRPGRSKVGVLSAGGASRLCPKLEWAEQVLSSWWRGEEATGQGQDGGAAADTGGPNGPGKAAGLACISGLMACCRLQSSTWPHTLHPQVSNSALGLLLCIAAYCTRTCAPHHTRTHTHTLAPCCVHGLQHKPLCVSRTRKSR